jgi:hypothetical protein
MDEVTVTQIAPDGDLWGVELSNTWTTGTKAMVRGLIEDGTITGDVRCSLYLWYPHEDAGRWDLRPQGIDVAALLAFLTVEEIVIEDDDDVV